MGQTESLKNRFECVIRAEVNLVRVTSGVGQIMALRAKCLLPGIGLFENLPSWFIQLHFVRILLRHKVAICDLEMNCVSLYASLLVC